MIINITKRMVGKMNGLRSINTSSRSNPFCQRMSKTNNICRHCYSIRLEKYYGSFKHNGGQGLVNAWVRNSKTLSKKLFKDCEVPLLKSKKWMRFHAHGELYNKTHLYNFIQIVEANPDTTFALWTKRLDIVKGNLKQLDNLYYVYSNPKLDKLYQELPNGFHKVFSVLTRPFILKRHLSHLVNCQSKCVECGLCYTSNDVTHIYEIKK